MPDEIRAPVCVADRNPRPGRTADADGVNRHALVGRGLRCVGHVALQVLAIGQQHEDAVVVPVLVEQPPRLLDRAGDVGALAGNQLGIESVQGLAEGVVVQRQRAQREGAPGEGNQAHAVALQPGDEVEDPEPRALQPVGREILRQHAARGVHGEEDVDALALHLPPLVAPLRPGDGGESKQHRQQPQPALEIPQARGKSVCEPLAEPRVDELGQIRIPPPVEAVEQQEQGGAGDHPGGDPERLREL